MRETIAEIDEALTHASLLPTPLRTTFVDKLLDERLNATDQAPADASSLS